MVNAYSLCYLQALEAYATIFRWILELPTDLALNWLHIVAQNPVN
jgi:hypothetical protein